MHLLVWRPREDKSEKSTSEKTTACSGSRLCDFGAQKDRYGQLGTPFAILPLVTLLKHSNLAVSTPRATKLYEP